MKRSLGSALLCLLGIVLVLGRGPSRAADEPAFVIPVINSNTGNAAFIGKEIEGTLHRVETVVNRRNGIAGRSVRFEFFDDQSRPEVAVQLINSIMGGGSQVVIGPTLTNACLAVRPLIGERIVEYCMSPGVEPAKGSFTFASSVAGTDIFRAMVRYFHRKGWNRVAAITTSDATGQQADQRLGAAIALPENKGVELVDQEHFSPTDLSVAAQIARIKAAHPQVLVAWVIATPFVTVLRSLSEAGFNVPLVASNSNMIYGEMKQWASYLPSQLLFSGPAFLGGTMPRPQRKAIAEFTSVTRDAGVVPDLPTALAWDPAMILISTIQKLGPTATAAQIQRSLEDLHDYPGIMGVYDFRTGNQRGLSQRDMTIERWDAKKNAWVAVSQPGGDPL